MKRLSAKEVVQQDLDYICRKLKEELKILRGKEVLITGGGGFLGYYLIQALLYSNQIMSDQKPVHVIVYDNLMRGVPDWLISCGDDENMELLKHDITNPLPEPDRRFDYIIHAASIASPIFYRQHPLETMDANVNGLRILLEYARKQKEAGTPLSGFLFFSTSEIYGDPIPSEIPTPETYRGNVSSTGPRACYDESKRYGETLCVTYADQFGLPVTIARPFNNYGPGLKITDRRVIPDFMKNVLEGKNIVMLSDGRPSRTFCYIADAICGYFKILLKGRPGEPYNIGVEEPEISILELAEMITDIAGEVVGYKGEVVRMESSDKNYLVDNPNRRCPVIRKAESELEYQPEIRLRDGLIRNLSWYKDNLVAEEA